MGFRILFLCFMIVVPAYKVLAQDGAAMPALPTPSDTTKGQAVSGSGLDKLTQSQLEALKLMFLKTGGQITPEMMNILKDNPELQRMTPEAARELLKSSQLKGEAPETKTSGETTQASPIPPGTQTLPTPGTQTPPTPGTQTPPTPVTQTLATPGTQVPSIPGIPLTEQKEEEPTKIRFGIDFFKPAQDRILSIEKGLGQSPATSPLAAAKPDAISGSVGPLDMVASDITATVPAHYALTPGDKVTIHFWADSIALTTYESDVDEEGRISVPQLGKLVVRGMTLSQLQESLKNQLERVLGKKDISLIATLGSLKSMQILIMGEAFRPGSYEVSAVTSLFNALYACGGPNEFGSLRNIKLLRGNNTTEIDFYMYLIGGENSQDYPLFPGDTIFIPRTEKLVSIEGEVNRPAIFELKREEKLDSLIAYANGLKPTGLIKKIQINSVKPNKERIIVDVDLTNESPSKIWLYGGDTVVVPPILLEILNKVTLQGQVDQPGEYELKAGMRVSDLFSESNRPRGEAYMDRADIIRLNPDKKTTTILSINLGRALLKDPANDIRLASLDNIIVYSKFDIKFLPSRKVNIFGSVQRPNEYERSNGMKISDLLVMGGGVMPDTSLERADLLRYDYSTGKYHKIAVNLKRVLNGVKADDLELQDGDQLTVYAQKDIVFTPVHEVEIYGAIQRPGAYTRSEKMKLSDLLYAAGGVVPGFYEMIEIAKARVEGEMNTVKVSLEKLKQGDILHNPYLDDGDIVMVRRKLDFHSQPMWVEIEGEIGHPGRYSLVNREERLSSIIERAGGMTSYAYPKGIVLQRKRENINTETQRSLLFDANDMINIMNNLDYERQLTKNQWLLYQAQGKDVPNTGISGGGISVSSGSDPAEAAAIGMAPGVAASTSQTVDKFLKTTEEGPGISSKARLFAKPDLEPREMQRLILAIKDIDFIKGGEEDIVLMPGDTIFIPRKQETVSLVGAVISSPGVIKYDESRQGKKYQYYIDRVGGYSEDANTEGVLVARVNGSVLKAEDVKSIEPGDIIYVPPRVISLEIETKTDKIIGAVKFSLVTVSGLAAFIALIGMF